MVRSNRQGNRLGLDGVALLSKALAAGFECLNELVLGGNHFGPAGAQALAPSLTPSVLPRLANLRFWQNSLADAGAAAVARALSGSSSLTLLDLEECEIGSPGALALEAELRNWPKLQTLDMRHNPCSDVHQRLLAAAALRLHLVL